MSNDLCPMDWQRLLAVAVAVAVASRWVASVVENERQHGRTRVPAAFKAGSLRQLDRTAVRGYLMEWFLERKSRGLGDSSTLPVVERLRYAIQFAKESKNALN